eukprot:6314321-Pyramimonas_sp.AAC.1
MSWLLAPAVGLALEPGLGARSRTNGGAACATGGGAAGSAGACGTYPWLSGRHPNLPEGGLVIDPSGCRGIVKSSKPDPRALAAKTVGE